MHGWIYRWDRRYRFGRETDRETDRETTIEMVCELHLLFHSYLIVASNQTITKAKKEKLFQDEKLSCCPMSLNPNHIHVQYNKCLNAQNNGRKWSWWDLCWLCEFVLDITCVCVDQRRNSISEHSLLTHVHFTCFLQWNWPQTSKLSDVINFPPFVIVLAYHSWNIFLIIGFQNFSSSSNHSPSTLNQLTMAPYNHDSVCVLKSCSSNAIS